MTELASCHQDTMAKTQTRVREHGDLRPVLGDCDTCEAKKVEGAAMIFCGMQVFICQSCRRGLGL